MKKTICNKKKSKQNKHKRNCKNKIRKHYAASQTYSSKINLNGNDYDVITQNGQSYVTINNRRYKIHNGVVDFRVFYPSYPVNSGHNPQALQPYRYELREVIPVKQPTYEYYKIYPRGASYSPRVTGESVVINQYDGTWYIIPPGETPPPTNRIIPNQPTRR